MRVSIFLFFCGCSAFLQSGSPCRIAYFFDSRRQRGKRRYRGLASYLTAYLLEFYESLCLQFRCEEGWRQTIPIVDGVVERTPKGYGLRVDSPNPRRQDGILTHQYGEIYYSNVPCGNPRLKLATQNGSFCAIN